MTVAEHITRIFENCAATDDVREALEAFRHSLERAGLLVADHADARPVRTGFMCAVDFGCELGAALGGNLVFPSVEDCAEHRQCTDECGVVEVEVRMKGFVPGYEGSDAEQ